MQQLLNVSGCHFFPDLKASNGQFLLSSVQARLSQPSAVSAAGAHLPARAALLCLCRTGH